MLERWRSYRRSCKVGGEVGRVTRLRVGVGLGG